MIDTEILQDILTDHKLCKTQEEEIEKAIQLLNHSDDIDKAFLKMCKKENKYQKINQECIDTVGVGIEMMPLKFKEFFKDFEEFYRYRELKEQGRLVELPCKIGDTVYEPRTDRGFISTYRVTSIVIVNDKSRNYNWELIEGIYSNLNGFNEFAIGKTVFLTKAEAEKAQAEEPEKEIEDNSYRKAIMRKFIKVD